MRERGKIVRGSRREGPNVWTDTGREYLSLRISQQIAGSPPSAVTPFRVDTVGYIGVGDGGGSQLEDVNVIRLASPLPYTGSTFLAPLEVPPTFPLAPKQTTVRYRRVFAENQITVGTDPVSISELGLFTNGDPASENASDPRDTTLADAENQAPLAYTAFEPYVKTNALSLEVLWDIRF